MSTQIHSRPNMPTSETGEPNSEGSWRTGRHPTDPCCALQRSLSQSASFWRS